MVEKILTLCIVHNKKQILLGMKKRGFGAGRWNGFGGKLDAGETVLEASHRELEEESGIKALDMKERGKIKFHFLDTDLILIVHLFSVTKYSGTPIETEEMKPEWYDLDKIPYDSMWPDDKYWLPQFMKGKNIEAKFNFKGNDEIIFSEIKEY